MKNILKPAIFALLSVIVLSSCNKYVDGPKFSLLTKKARLSGEWVIESVSVDGVDLTSSYTTVLGANFVLEIEKDGVYRTEGAFPETGTWVLGEDKDDIRMKSDVAGSLEQSYRILRLKSKELWWKHTETNGSVTT